MKVDLHCFVSTYGCMMAAFIILAVCFFVSSIYYRPYFDSIFNRYGYYAASLVLWGGAVFCVYKMHTGGNLATLIAALFLSACMVVSPYIAKKLCSPYHWLHFFPCREMVFSCKTDKPYVALTFDGGPLEGRTAGLLDVMKAHDAHVTFFLLGKYIEGQEEVVRRMHRDGHAIGNHSWNHIPLNELTDQQLRDEIERTNDAISSITGERVGLIRLPGGTLSPSQARNIVRRYRMHICVWNAMAATCAGYTGPHGAGGAQGRTGCGDIVLIHDSEITPEELDALLTSLEKKGLKCVTIPELLSTAGGN